MKNLIIYYSRAGHTKRYAEFLSTRIIGDVKEISEINLRILRQYDNIIFGSSIRNNKIMKINKFLKYYKKIKNKNLFIFANGFSTMQGVSSDDKQLLIDINGLFDKHIRFYTLPGGFDYDLLNKKDKRIFSIAFKFSNKDGETANLEETIKSRKIDLVSADNLDRIVSVIHLLEQKEIK